MAQILSPRTSVRFYKNLALRRQNRASALVFSLILIAVLAMAAGFYFKSSLNRQKVGDLDLQKLELFQRGDEAFEIIKKRIYRSAKYFNKLKEQCEIRGVPDGYGVDNCEDFQAYVFSLYKNPSSYESQFLENDDFDIDLDEYQFDLKTQFIDWARTGGYLGIASTSTSDQEFSFSVRCLKDTREFDRGDPEYNSGEVDGCPVSVNGSRDDWSFENWSKLPKKIEFKVRVAYDGMTQINRSIAELRPVNLNDYAVAFGEFAETDCDNPYHIYGNTFTGRFHLNSGAVTCDDGQTPYYVMIDTMKNSAVFHRPFTTSGKLMTGVA